MQQQRINKTEISVNRSMIPCASTAILVAALMVFGGNAYSSSTPTTEQLQQVVVAHYRAIEDNQIDQAMQYYHSQSPEIVRTRENIEFGLSQFLLKTTTIKFCYAGQEGEIAVVTAKHKYLMISGIKIMKRLVDVVYQLREEQGSWKIWSQRDSANGIAKLLMCEN